MIFYLIYWSVKKWFVRFWLGSWWAWWMVIYEQNFDKFDCLFLPSFYWLCQWANLEATWHWPVPRLLLNPSLNLNVISFSESFAVDLHDAFKYSCLGCVACFPWSWLGKVACDFYVKNWLWRIHSFLSFFLFYEENQLHNKFVDYVFYSIHPVSRGSLLRNRSCILRPFR